MNEALLSEINRTIIYGARASGFIADVKPVVDIHDREGMHIASVFPQDKYIQFNEGFTQFGCEVPIFKQLMENGYDSNHV